MDRRLLTGLVVLGVAIAVGVGVLVFGGGDDSGDDTTSTSALSNDERPDPTTAQTGDTGDGKDGGNGGNQGGGDQDGRNGGANDGGSDSGSDGEPTGPPIEQDPPDNGRGDEPVGDPADVSAVTTTLTTYLESIASGNGEDACAQLSPAGQRTMLKKIGRIAPETKGSACPQAILLYQGAYGKSAIDPSFKAIKVSGGRATAIGPLKEPARLSETGDGWLIDEYGQ